jgi:hypothetical protein
MGNLKTSVTIVAGLKTVTYVDPDTEVIIGQDVGPATPEEIAVEQARLEAEAAAAEAAEQARLAAEAQAAADAAVQAAAEVSPDPVPDSYSDPAI